MNKEWLGEGGHDHMQLYYMTIKLGNLLLQKSLLLCPLSDSFIIFARYLQGIPKEVIYL